MALTNKQAIILNYGQMLNELGMDMQEHTSFISHFFDNEPNLNHDADLMDIAREFQEFCLSLKRLDAMINSKHKRVFS
jgi:hypothetical protein